ILGLLYTIADDQSKREGYVHDGITCNLCGVEPIRGVRYRCTQCLDYDLCQVCESIDLHPQGHVFYKVRVPIPALNEPNLVPVRLYPGSPQLARTLPANLAFKHIVEIQRETAFKQSEIVAQYEKFRCLVTDEHVADCYGVCGAISAESLAMLIAPHISGANLLVSRLIKMYDRDGDGLVSFRDYIVTLDTLWNGTDAARLYEVFKGYDLDDDGLVGYDDFKRIFASYLEL
ncbi:uncharacterized protein V1510DRAFT_350352, partial [Dipodascopsis tothii]|uniref:uncharacterized protein n=1 Tax=Dipodascopsis tothii TaxID=44089 RepID=UPI0034CDFD0F